MFLPLYIWVWGDISGFLNVMKRMQHAEVEIIRHFWCILFSLWGCYNMLLTCPLKPGKPWKLVTSSSKKFKCPLKPLVVLKNYSSWFCFSSSNLLFFIIFMILFIYLDNTGRLSVPTAAFYMAKQSVFPYLWYKKDCNLNTWIIHIPYLLCKWIELYTEMQTQCVVNL